jgi:hypothetical protein
MQKAPVVCPKEVSGIGDCKYKSAKDERSYCSQEIEGRQG